MPTYARKFTREEKRKMKTSFVLALLYASVVLSALWYSTSGRSEILVTGPDVGCGASILPVPPTDFLIEIEPVENCQPLFRDGFEP